MANGHLVSVIMTLAVLSSLILSLIPAFPEFVNVLLFGAVYRG